jgi:hypothetical protein
MVVAAKADVAVRRNNAVVVKNLRTGSAPLVKKQLKG